MSILNRSLSLVCAWSVGLLGCEQSDCEKACEAAKECPQVPATYRDLDCSDGCDFQEQASNIRGCGDEWDAFNTCGAANVDRACENGTCGAEATAWNDCLQ
jgi:hypothetical protein